MYIAELRQRLTELAPAHGVQLLNGAVADKSADVHVTDLTAEQWLSLAQDATPPVIWLEEGDFETGHRLTDWLLWATEMPDYVKAILDRLPPDAGKVCRTLIARFKRVYKPDEPAFLSLSLAIQGILYNGMIADDWAGEASVILRDLRARLDLHHMEARSLIRSEQVLNERVTEQDQANQLQAEVVEALAKDEQFRACKNIRQRQGVARQFLHHYRDRPGFHLVAKRVPEIADTAHLQPKAES